MDIKGNDFVLFDNYYFDDIKLNEIRNNKLYATYWNYQTSNEPFSFEIDVVTKEVKDSFLTHPDPFSLFPHNFRH